MSTIFDNAESFTVPVSERPQENNTESNFKFEDWFTPPTLNGKEIPLFKPKLGLNKIDILPFQLGSNLLASIDPKKTEGTVVCDITLDIYMKVKKGTVIKNMVSRNNLGLEGDPFLFDPHKEERIRNFTLAQKNHDSPEWKKAVSLFPVGSNLIKPRQLVLVMEYDEAGNRSLHYWAPSWHVLGKLLKIKQDNLAKVGQKISYGDPLIGKSIYFTGETKKMDNGTTYIGFSAVEIIDREKAYPEDIYTKMPKLDLCVKVPTEAELIEMLPDNSPYFTQPKVAEAPKEETVQVAPPKVETPVVETVEVQAESIVDTPKAPTVTSDTPLNLDEFSF